MRAGRGETRGARETRETSERGRASGYQKGGAARAAHVLTLHWAYLPVKACRVRDWNSRLLARFRLGDCSEALAQSAGGGTSEVHECMRDRCAPIRAIFRSMSQWQLFGAWRRRASMDAASTNLVGRGVVAGRLAV